MSGVWAHTTPHPPHGQNENGLTHTLSLTHTLTTRAHTPVQVEGAYAARHAEDEMGRLSFASGLDIFFSQGTSRAASTAAGCVTEVCGGGGLSRLRV